MVLVNTQLLFYAGLLESTLKTVLTYMSYGLLAVWALIFSQGVLAEAFNPTPQQLEMFSKLSDSQKQALIQKFGGKLNSSNSQSGTSSQPAADNQAQSNIDQTFVQPAAPIAPEIPSAIETSMRARLASDMKASVREKAGDQNSQGGQGGQNFLGGQGNLKNSDLVAPEKAEQNYIASSRDKDIELRSSWERFLINRKVRGVDNNFSQYGYQLFSGTSGTFAPATDIACAARICARPGRRIADAAVWQQR